MPDSFTKAFDQLNTDQQEAVQTIYGPLQVVAGPGTGKTQLLALRVANILRETDVLPQNILCLTYTEAGAANMRERIVQLVGDAGYKVPVFTFHGFGSDVINRFGEHFYSGAVYRPADQVRMTEVVEELLSKLSKFDPLAIKNNGVFSMISDIVSMIDQLKKNGIAPADFAKIIEQNGRQIEQISEIIEPLLAERVSKKSLDAYAQALTQLQTLKAENRAVEPHRTFLEVFIANFAQSLRDAAEHPKVSPPLSEWKKTWSESIKKPVVKKQLKAVSQHAKHLSLAKLYPLYQSDLHAKNLFDFSDMILEVIAVLEKNEALRADVSESYQFVMVDEFQDTNAAQLRLLQSVLNQDQPNVMVVGDDDQGIFKFQGAEVSNIIDFRKNFTGAQMTVLQQNYRSGSNILQLARQVVLKGEHRLENQFDFINKELQAQEKNGKGEVKLLEFSHVSNERQAISEQIKKQLDSGIVADEIAVIAPRHKQLEALVPYLVASNIPIRYDAKQDVLSEPIVAELLDMLRLVALLHTKRLDDANQTMAKVLEYSCWGISSEQIWKLSVLAYKGRSFWTEKMLEHEDERVQKPAKIFLALARSVSELSFEQIFDILIGNEPITFDGEEIVSPLKQHYFSTQKYQEQHSAYLRLLSAIRTLRDTIRNYFSETTPTLSDALSLIDTYIRNGLTLSDTSKFSGATKAVQLMTAYGAKGLEFEHVYVVEANESRWVRPRGRGALIKPPANLDISVPEDTIDDWLRLFYVALTRAKQHLVLTNSVADDTKTPPLPLQFLHFDTSLAQFKQVEVSEQSILKGVENDVFGYRHLPKSDSEEAALKDILEHTKLSVTSLQKYTDLEYSGPANFLFESLLRFPSGISPDAAFGNAVHAALATHTKDNKKPINDLFSNELKKQHLSKTEYDKQLARGKAILEGFLLKNKEILDEDIISELGFGTEHVVVNEVPLTGAIDAFVKVSKTQGHVIDYKTGHAYGEWQNNSKLHFYKRQLVFYKLLVENSRSYSQYKVTSGTILFVEPDNDGAYHALHTEITDQDVAELRALLASVWQRVQNLDFPDVSSYSKSFAGTKKFEAYLMDKTDV